MKQYRLRADLALVAVSFIWGASFVMVKEALADASPITFLAARFSLAALCLAIIFRRHLAEGLTRRELLAGLITGTILMLAYMLQTVGLNYTTASKSGFITGLYIPLVPFFASIVYRRIPHWLEWVGVVCSTVGMTLMSVQGASLAISYGDLLTVGCAVMFAVHILVLDYYTKRMPFESLAFLQIAGAAVVAIVSFWWLETPQFRLTGPVILAVAVGGIFSTALAFTVQSWAQQHTTPTRTALIFALEPVFAGLTSYVVEHEVLSARAGFGALLILAGILLVELKPRVAAAHPST